MKNDTASAAANPEALREIEGFENHYGYDATYMKEMLEHAPEALAAFSAFVPMASHRKHAPLEVYFTAKLTAYRHADCGPCLQLAVRFAQEAGVAESLIRSLVFEEGDLPANLARVQTFTRLCLRNDPGFEAAREDLTWELGKPTLAELSLAIAAAQVFPIVKRALGHYRSCSIVKLEV